VIIYRFIVCLLRNKVSP